MNEQRRAQPTDRASHLVRFFDAFLQEANIKWVLCTGAAILLASAIMLMVNHWQEIRPWLRYVFMAGTIATIEAAGRAAYFRLSLQRTGRVLLGLAVLLWPIALAALGRWNLTWPTALALGSITTLLTARCGHSVFGHFLRGQVPSFTAAYIALGFLGAAGGVLGPLVAPVVLGAAWLVMLVASVKVNRHSFRLSEQYRRPPIAAFLPLLLLAGQFVLLFCLWALPHWPTPWLGFSIALAAAPLLLTADTVARIFQQRTGNLVRPLPTSIMAPVVTGLALCTVGLALALTGVADLADAPQLGRAVVPTALLVTAMMAGMARRTKHPGFFWASLLIGTLAYNFSPVFFLSLARQVIVGGAQAIGEDRLPYAFYGLTYLPLLAALVVASWRCQKRGWSAVSGSLHSFVSLLASLLLMAGASHEKAAFPVAVCLGGLSLLQFFILPRRRTLFILAAALLLAAFGLEDFLSAVLGLDVPTSTTAAATALLGAGATVFSARLDHPIERSSNTRSGLGAMATGLASKLAVILLATASAVVLGCVGASLGTSLSPAAALLLGAAGSLVVLAWLFMARRMASSSFAIVGLGLAPIMMPLLHTAWGLGWPVVAEGAIGVLLVYWLGHRLLQYLQPYDDRPARTSIFSRAFERVSGWGLLGLIATVLIPTHVADTFFAFDSGAPFSLTVQLATILWAIDYVRTSRRSGATLAAGTYTLLTVGFWAAPHIDPSWWPLWATGAATSVLLVDEFFDWRRRRAANLMEENTMACREAINRGLRQLAALLLLPTSLAGLLFLDGPLRLAAVVATVVLGVWGRRCANQRLQFLAAVVLPWQVVLACFSIWGNSGSDAPTFSSGFWLHPSAFIAAALAAALGSFFSSRLRAGRPHWVLGGGMAWNGLQVRALHYASTALLLGSLVIVETDPINIIAALLCFALLAVDRLQFAHAHRREAAVWHGFALIALAPAYLAHFRHIHFGSGMSMFTLLILAAVLYGLAGRCPAVSVFKRPLERIAAVLPAIAFGLAYIRFVGGSGDWLGRNSLAALIAAAQYIYHASRSDKHSYTILGAVLANIAIALVSWEAGFADPQVFMVPIGMSIIAVTTLLRNELEERLRSICYYVGALTILVSPLFHIVSGSWWHLLSLALASVATSLLAVGLRVRPLAYTGSAFLVADLIAIVARGSIDRPSLMWVALFVLGSAVLGLGALAEGHRERLLQRMRLLSAELQTWQ